MDPKEAFRLDNLPRTVLTLLAATILYLAGLFSRGVYPILQKVVQDLPKEALTVLVVFLLLVLALVTGLLVNAGKRDSHACAMGVIGVRRSHVVSHGGSCLIHSRPSH